MENEQELVTIAKMDKLQKAVRIMNILSKKDPMNDDMIKAQKALLKPYLNRSSDDFEIIEKMMGKVKFFVKLKLKYGLIIFKEVCKHLYYKRCQPDKQVITINSEGSTFYVILKGSVGINIFLPKFTLKKASYSSIVYIPEVDVSDGHLEYMEINTLTPGDSFGDMALLDPTAKTVATVITKEISEFACLDKFQYLRILGSLNQNELHEKIEFVRNIDFLQSWFENDIKTLSFHFECLYFDRKDYVFMENDELDGYVYFLRKGEVQLLKQQNNKQIKLCNLVVGEMFGEEEFMTISSRQYTAKCTMQDTQVFRLLKNDLEKRMWQNQARVAFKQSTSIRQKWRLQRFANNKYQAEIKVQPDNLNGYLNPDNYTDNTNDKIASKQPIRQFNFMEPTTTLQFLGMTKKTRQINKMESMYNKTQVVERQKLLSQSSSKPKDKTFEKFKRVNVQQMKNHLVSKYSSVHNGEDMSQFNFITEDMQKDNFVDPTKVSRQSSHKVLIDEVSLSCHTQVKFNTMNIKSPTNAIQNNHSKSLKTSEIIGIKGQQSPKVSYEVKESKTSLRFKRIFQF